MNVSVHCNMVFCYDISQQIQRDIWRLEMQNFFFFIEF